MDPSDDTTFWALGEYASAHGTYGSQWNTRFAKFNIGPSGAGNTAEGVTVGNVQIPFRVGMTDDQIAEAIRDAINSAAVQAVLEIRAGLSDGRSRLGNTASTSNLVNLYGNAMANRYGSTAFGDIDKTAGAGDVLIVRHRHPRPERHRRPEHPSRAGPGRHPLEHDQQLAGLGHPRRCGRPQQHPVRRHRADGGQRFAAQRARAEPPHAQ